MTTNTALVQQDPVIISLQRAGTALAEAKTVQQTKKILDVAAAAEIYAKRQHLGEEAEKIALSIKVEALRKLGEMLKATPKAKGAAGMDGNQHTGKVVRSQSGTAPTLAELGLDKKESAVAQKLASLSDEAFEQVREGHVTVAKALAAVDAAKKASKDTKATATSTPEQRAPGPVAVRSSTEAPEQEADEAGDFDPVAELQQQMAINAGLQAQIKAAEADDLKAEAMKWRRAYEHAQRTADDKMANAARLDKELQALHNRMLRIGKLFGERDPAKIPALVESFFRQHAKVAA